MTVKPFHMSGAVFLLGAMLFLGFGSMPAAAQVVPPIACLACPFGACPCSSAGTASTIKNDLDSSLKSSLKSSANSVETDVSNKTDDMMKELLDSTEETEQRLISWWQSMWYERLLPDLQGMVSQLTVAVADQSRNIQSFADAVNLNKTRLAHQKQQIERQRALRPDDNVCTRATLAGGYARANNFATAMRKAWQKESLAIGLGDKGTPGATGAAAAERQRYDTYKGLFCVPNGNGGKNECGSSDPVYYNADTQPAKFIYNRQTIDVTDPKLAQTVETITNNLVGVPSADPIAPEALASATGQQTLLDRRSYLAKYAAIRSVPQMIAAWRMPGSQMGTWVKSLRESAGTPLANISANPSYHEVMRAASIDRFNSGHYAGRMTTDPDSVEVEKLTLNTFYLMQLRDYYELLERTALTLAVQVSMMADQVPLPNVSVVQPVK